ncbi:hypothetical protein ACHWQZ_G001214 [Mnemiopsis leidyi]
MSVTASAAAKEEQSVAAAESESQEKTNSNDDRTVYQNQKVIDAVDEGITYKGSTMPRSRAGSFIGTVKSYDTSLEKKKLTDPDKSKATVAEIYPWIKEEAEPKRKITNLAQLVKDNKRKGLSKRHNLILDLTEEVRTLRAEVEDVLFYDNEDTLQVVLQELWEEHHKLIQQFEYFMSDLTVDSPLPSPLSIPEETPTPTPILEDRARRRLEWRFKNLFKFPVDESKADKEFEKTVKPTKFDL